jgi:hypothetical protein
MKNLLLFIILLGIVNSCAVKKEIYFTGGIQPNMNYQYESHEEVNSIINIAGPPEDIDNLIKNGFTVPRIDEGYSIWKSSTVTGSMSNEKTYPFTIVFDMAKFDKIDNGEKSSEFFPVSGSTIKGFVNQSKRLIIDTIISENPRNDLKLVADDYINRGDTFPSLKLKKGNTFKVERKVKTPVLQYFITKTFKLKKISNDIAYFHVKQDFSFAKDLYPNARIKGSGNGVYIFNLNYKCFIKQDEWYNISIYDRIGDLKIKQTMSAKSKTDSPASKNKDSL